MWVLHFRLILHLRLSKSPMDYFGMNLHASIAYKFWFSFNGHTNYILVISKWPYMWVLHLKLGLHLKSPKSLMGYIGTNLNIGIAFSVKHSYNFVIPTHVFIFTNYKFGLNFLNNYIKFVTKHKSRYVSYHLIISSSWVLSLSLNIYI
jgi:hypothetical protein